MSIVEIRGGGDRRSMFRRYERKSKHDAIRELIALLECNWRRVELLEAELESARNPLPAAVQQLLEYAQASQPADGTGRTPKDYAIEHAEYLAASAERVSDAFDQYGLALIALEQEDDTTDELLNAVDDTRMAVQDALRTLRSHVYEFRKRRVRAQAGGVSGAVVAAE